MIPLPHSEKSYWIESTQIESVSYPKLTEDLEVDVAIIRAGIAGLTTAYLLHKAGKKVAVLEKATLASGISGHTTGKVTSQHGLIYHELAKHSGVKTARLYGQANEAAIAKMDEIIKNEAIECEWQRDTNYVFTENPEEIPAFRLEARTAEKLGLLASFNTNTSLPFMTEAAVSFANQAKIHSKKYLQGLARVVQNGSYVFENTKVTKLTMVQHQQPSTPNTELLRRKIPSSPQTYRFHLPLTDFTARLNTH